MAIPSLLNKNNVISIKIYNKPTYFLFMYYTNLYKVNIIINIIIILS